MEFHLWAYQCPEREASLSFLTSTLRNVPLERCLADIQGSGLHHFAHAFVRLREKSDGPKSRTDAVTEIHDRLGTSNDLILVVATDLDQRRWRRGRGGSARVGGEEVRAREMERERGACAGEGVSVLTRVKEREGVRRQEEGTCAQWRGAWAGGKGEGAV